MKCVSLFFATALVAAGSGSYRQEASSEVAPLDIYSGVWNLGSECPFVPVIRSASRVPWFRPCLGELFLSPDSFRIPLGP